MPARLPSSLTACACAATLLAFCLGRAAGPRASAPVAMVSPGEIDLGPVKVGRSAIAGFTLTNQGAARLIIRDVKSSCECNLPTLARRDLNPGESESLTVVFKPTAPGFRRHQILVQTNDPQCPALVVTLVATGTP